jgi:hypothetical protein
MGIVTAPIPIFLDSVSTWQTFIRTGSRPVFDVEQIKISTKICNLKTYQI